ncbi:D-alanine--D-alanine ligase family protein [Aspergillus novofumigatus IBT 16806]|uniref:Glutathione synthetase ATP-binding domain-like protein n=1 Tax=Aspergillus novofumigatus (strain IBT 16806) TaxID=1392255 RepID=A0A2I1CF49_ASPN1|nr:glutathione synthetase ATP-binding domain-like protein [Aspergillus novofumigatus IBT 16806]PKX96249.1 glutathione synthetase ATP-binding domain-like protein [Aspergillus novofumigatus IBT 16806]
MTAGNLRIAFVHLELFGPEDGIIRMAHENEAVAITSTLESLGHEEIQVPGMESLLKSIVTGKYREWDLAFNISHGLHGKANDAQVPGILEAYQITSTFSDAGTLALCQDKSKANLFWFKIMLEHYEISTAPFAVDKRQLKNSHHAKSLSSYPWFVKPNIEAFSKGVVPSNRDQTPEELESAIKVLRQKFPQRDILVETFLPGQEFTVGILGTGCQARVIGMATFTWKQANTQSSHQLIDFHLHGRSNVIDGLAEKVIVDINHPGVKKVCEISLRAWNALGCRDGGRVDIRLDGESKPHVLEINPIPGLWNGISFSKLLESIVDNALDRKEITCCTHIIATS